MALRQEVLSAYRRVLRLAANWHKYSAQEADIKTEKKYIKSEAIKLFHQNKHVCDEEEIRMHLKEAETRIEMAIHYQNPYPRPVNIPQNVLPPLTSKLKKGQKRAIKQSKPVYLKSYEDDTLK